MSSLSLRPLRWIKMRALKFVYLVLIHTIEIFLELLVEYSTFLVAGKKYYTNKQIQNKLKKIFE